AEAASNCELLEMASLVFAEIAVAECSGTVVRRVFTSTASSAGVVVLLSWSSAMQKHRVRLEVERLEDRLSPALTGNGMFAIIPPGCGQGQHDPSPTSAGPGRAAHGAGAVRRRG